MPMGCEAATVGRTGLLYDSTLMALLTSSSPRHTVHTHSHTLLTVELRGNCDVYDDLASADAAALYRCRDSAHTISALALAAQSLTSVVTNTTAAVI